MKCCNKCGILKPLYSYHKRTNKSDSYVSWCKECHINYKKEARKTKKGVLASIYEGQIYSSKKRGHDKPKYSKKDFIDWCLTQEIFHKLYDAWCSSGYKKDLVPSVDRINDYEGYCFQNIQIMTWGDNRSKAHKDMREGRNNKQSRAVSQYTLEGVWITDYHSINEAARAVGGSDCGIGNVCTKKPRKFKNKDGSHRYVTLKTACGFRWTYLGQDL